MRLDTIHSLIIVAMVALATQITRWTPFLLFSGGKKLPEDEALTMAYRAISDGARGVDMGRNIFQSEHPAAMCRAVAKIVHEKFTDREAFQFYQELAAQDN